MVGFQVFGSYSLFEVVGMHIYFHTMTRVTAKKMAKKSKITFNKD